MGKAIAYRVPAEVDPDQSEMDRIVQDIREML